MTSESMRPVFCIALRCQLTQYLDALAVLQIFIIKKLPFKARSLWAGLLLEGCSLLVEQDSLESPYVLTDSAVQLCLVQPDSMLRAWCR